MTSGIRKGRCWIYCSPWWNSSSSGTHGSSWDKEGNLYVKDWDVSGRIMKLVRVKCRIRRSVGD
jgi:hypothetical protein